MAEQLQFPELVDIKGAAEYLSTSIRHIRRLAQKGELAFVKIGGLIRFDKADLQRYIDDNRHPSKSHEPSRPRGHRASTPVGRLPDGSRVTRVTPGGASRRPNLPLR